MDKSDLDELFAFLSQSWIVSFKTPMNNKPLNSVVRLKLDNLQISCVDFHFRCVYFEKYYKVYQHIIIFTFILNF